MNRSRLMSDRAGSSFQDDTSDAIASRSLRLPLAVIVSSLLIAGIWFFQQTSLRHLNEQIRQLQQDIDKIPPRSLTAIDRIALQKELIILEGDRINAQNGVYNLLFQGAGAIILGGLAHAGWKYLRRTDAQFQSTNDRLYTDRFSQAISHLASDKIEIRLGGIYTLERLAQDSTAEYWLTIEVLTAFVRERSAKIEIPPTLRILEPPPKIGDIPDPKPSRKSSPSSRIPTDIQAVMTILNRRDVSKDRPDRIIELRESNLRDAELSGIELWGADLWKVNFRQAQLWQAKLAGASLGRANLSDASLWQADLEGAYLWKANLEGANLSEANLEQANLEGSNLKGANLLQTNLINADLRKVVGLTRQQLSQAICDETTQLPDYLKAVSS
ncbi:pentapeptide repeat-containing protein [Chamaesiphon sp. GL140_3_metabinner_50]|uniref:pentapeptide repeat-containing protein n=1 Tax=Chamaesiphon sp. GL140_3_metabinner_50 TaxID=2970812 RepID=UPI0025DFA4E2|nr:pentapeptide repeat-containing protein [Chamaesiphon sp. GL140_3_metabinner_50]